ncbi:hypothetical protein PTSG_03293 [Salpingoeca rosetta]|uniref:Exostosin GT47 domain-containing protein n=1 Tax=Salpingoeca rosetta (strain ATCC 50818 / BSB-021) TaxID=946362 RepID=F2U4S0_SALR5|nr:uncharacterized protein PTSG_03293 [Salpingoeca rosetta]EGD82636.1 hypothetical protein PTSG_03293 [Salpingoeca rosetta]|eukprot:XP_004995872.1 hypothetical protein PTSG_03293 [Salpingoeca rosetta]
MGIRGIGTASRAGTSDYGHVRKHSKEELQRVCDATPHCAGFNTNGWLKTSTAKRVAGAADLCVKRQVAEQRVHVSAASDTGSDDTKAPLQTDVVADVLGALFSRHLRVYMYPLPESLQLPPTRDYKYAAEATFTRMLRASTFSTDSPEEAQLFFVRVSCAEARFTQRDREAGQRAADAHATAVLAHVQQRYPYWNRTQGRDHFFVCGHDMGAAPRTAAARMFPSARNMIALVNTADVTEPDYVVHKDISLPPHVGDGCPTPRLMDAIWAGCVPVFIADHYDPPLAKYVDWALLAVFIAEADAAHIKAHLEMDARTMYAHRSAYIARVRDRLTWWDPAQRQHTMGRSTSAFDLVMLELALRVGGRRR